MDEIYSGSSIHVVCLMRPIPCLLMLWPGHPQTLHWRSKPEYSVSSIRRVNMVPTDLQKCWNLTAVLKSAWFCNLPWKLAMLQNDFLWAWKIMAPETFFLCILQIDFNWLKRFDNFVIKSVSVIHVFHCEYCNLVYGKLFYHRIMHLQWSR